MADRDFSDSIKLAAIKNNLEKNEGSILCETCGKKLISIAECHFDHVFPFAKGGKSTLSNCQILCVDCNLKKNDKLLDDFMLEEKARKFLAGETFLEEDERPVENIDNKEGVNHNDNLSKEDFDSIISRFIDKKGDIKKIDFSRSYNNLPSFRYVQLYYKDLNTLKKAFGITDLSLNWNREAIKDALVAFVENNGDIVQDDLKKKNNLPSLPCVLSYYPEYANFTEIKEGLLNLKATRKQWTRESAIKAGKEFVRSSGKITEKDLKYKNGLPTSKVIYRLFGSINEFQKEVGSTETHKNDLITKEEIEEELDRLFAGRERIIDSQKDFFSTFKYSQSTVCKRYGNFSEFCLAEKITVRNTKKARYTKREVDDAISLWVKNGNPIPKVNELTKNGLPSIAAIMKYYEHWKEPFILYSKLYEEASRN